MGIRMVVTMQPKEMRAMRRGTQVQKQNQIAQKNPGCKVFAPHF